MLKKAALAVFGLILAMSLASPKKAEAAVHVHVAIGAPVAYGYYEAAPAPYAVYGQPDYDGSYYEGSYYAAPAYPAYGGGYYYSYPAYGEGYYYGGYRRDHEHWEHRDRDRDHWRGDHRWEHRGRRDDDD